MRRGNENRDPHARKGDQGKPTPREGWAEAFGETEELGDEDLAWLGFGNEDDADLAW
jgi:hypothetical protein